MENLSSISNNTDTDFIRLSVQVSKDIALICQERITTLKNELVSTIRANHMFDSCEAVANSSLTLPAGMYLVRAANCTSIRQNCSTDIS